MSDSFVTPWKTIAHQFPLSTGFSRQEYWNGLPFPLPGDLPDPGIETMSPALQAVSLLLNHWGSPYVCVLVTQSCPTLCDPMTCSPPGSSVHGILQARILEWVAIPFSGIFLTQGLNLSFLHYRQILYHLSHRGSLKDQK